jgi:hypothetical protein
MTAVGIIAYCMAGENKEAIDLVDCLGDNADYCVMPYVCYGMFGCDAEEL